MCTELVAESLGVIVPFRTRKPMTDDQIIIAAIDRALLDRVSTTKLRQARVRALNLFHSNTQMDEALRRATAWALCTTDEGPQPPSPARAA